MLFLKNKIFWIALILLVPLTVAGRTVQLLYMTEPATGFFKQDMAGLGIAMGVVLGAALAAVLVLCRCLRPEARPRPERNIPLAVVSFLLAAVQLYEAAAVMLTDAGLGIGDVLHMLLLFGSIAFFAMLGVSSISYLPLPHILTLLPVLLWGFRLITAFTHYTGIASIAENILDIAMLCFSLFFMLEQGKFLCGDEKKPGRWLLAGGVCTAVLCAAATLPRYILAICGQGSLIHDGAMPNFTDLVLAVYIIVFAASLFPWRQWKPVH